MPQNKKTKNAIAVLCVICVVLTLAYSFVVFLPHAHECIGAGCTVCAMVEITRKIFVFILLSSTLHLLTRVLISAPGAVFRILSWRDNTPVGLKVKLSD